MLKDSEGGKGKAQGLTPETRSLQRWRAERGLTRLFIFGVLRLRLKPSVCLFSFVVFAEQRAQKKQALCRRNGTHPFGDKGFIVEC